MVLTLWVVFTITFFLMRSVPGGPFSSERQVPQAVKENFERRYRLDQPLPVQYFEHLVNTIQLDFGLSFKLVDFSVNEVIAAGFPVSASLGVLALVFALSLGMSAGIISATRRGTALDLAMMSIATIGIALPSFVVAGLLIILLVFLVPIFPAGGWGTAWNLVLPAFCLGAPYAAEIARLVRTGMLDVLGQDYVRTAYAKGLSTRSVIFGHALKGAMLPVVSFLGPAVAGILTGSLVIEQIFAIPGLGFHFIQAATQRDYTLAMGLVLLYTALLYTMNLLVDMAYALLDPRIKLE
jgi:oligopeptide transport system permease protein